MKKVILIPIAVLISTLIFSQNDDPYKAFGHQSKVEYKTTFGELFYIKNPDTASMLRGIGFDAVNRYIVFIGNDNTVLKKVEVRPDQVFRFLSPDPLSSKEPGWSPYRAFFDNPLRYTDPSGLLEFDNYKGYKKYAKENNLEILSQKEIGSQGHWLRSDRLGNSEVWGAANTFNIKNNVQNQYAPYEQVRDFYKWVDSKSGELSHEVKWMRGAIGLVSALADNLEGGSMFVNNEVESLLSSLNAGIQNGTLSSFNDLLFGKFSGTPLKGDAAQAWDVALVNYEQGQIATPIYANASQTAIAKMNEMVNAEPGTWHGFMGFVGGTTPHFNWFNADITTTQARIDVPLLMMYPATYKPQWSGFSDKVTSSGTLNARWLNIMKAYQVK
ncbi:MAG: hypothetical protein KF746_14680 [Chitinophagaceae bacterium]|nr:hypothetical protein [Chitinophagaceae bacterium]